MIEDYLRSLFPDRRGPDDADAAPSDTDGLFISLHSYSELILFPWGWTRRLVAEWRRTPDAGAQVWPLHRLRGLPGLPKADCLYLADGTTDDWSYGELGVASYTFELGTAFFQSCSVFEDQILDRGIDALTYAMKARVVPMKRLAVRRSWLDGKLHWSWRQTDTAPTEWHHKGNVVAKDRCRRSALTCRRCR